MVDLPFEPGGNVGVDGQKGKGLKPTALLDQAHPIPMQLRQIVMAFSRTEEYSPRLSPAIIITTNRINKMMGSFRFFI